MPTHTTTAVGLRAWARGSHPDEAAVELLLRGFGGRFAAPGWPWIQTCDVPGRWWVDPDTLLEELGVFSSGEQRILGIVAGLLGATDTPSLADLVTGLDRGLVGLVLAAVAHAAGTHEHSDLVGGPDGCWRIERLPSLYPWPPDEASS